MKFLIIFALLLTGCGENKSSSALSQAGGASSICYQVSKDNFASFSKTPEMICVESLDVTPKSFKLTLESGMPFNRQVFATFNYSLLERAKCPDCNTDVFGISSPSNSTFNALIIKFDGKRDIQTGEERGTLLIGENKLYYRTLK